MQRNVIETLLGAVVLITAGIFLVFAYEGSEKHMEKGYVINARFNNAAGITLGSDARIGGIKVGVVSDMKLDPNTYDAVVSLQVRQGIKIPEDSSAAIVSSGLLGEKYIQLTPGGDDKMLAAGGKIQFTQSGVNLEEMIGKFMFSGGGVDKGNGAKSSSSSSSSAPNNNASAAPSAGTVTK